MTHPAFEQIDLRRVDALNLDFQTYVHRETGARHIHLACDDTNNAFMVAFPTFPTNSNGVAHILEHTTLCGSRRFPVRDPFFLMLRRSLNTYMNAFTGGDCTAYPFATQNRKDFDNLLSVYLDAVFFPTLDPLDFAQEGWRVEFKTPEDESKLVFKGVVYNEMKGAMSSEVAQLWQHLHTSIFRDSIYQFNSGGEPANIPDLTYEELTAFHAKHYHPTHATFMTYGSFPVAEHQDQFESNALREFSRREEILRVPPQPRFNAPKKTLQTYGVNDIEDTTSGTHVVWAWLLGPSAEPTALLEAHFLAGVLLDHGASPLRRYLETTDLAEAPSELCGIDDSTRELILSCGVEGTDPVHVEQLNSEIFKLLEQISTNGIEKETLVGVVDQMEIGQRDLGGGGYPYGLQLMGRILPGAIHDSHPVDLIDIDDVLLLIRERIEDPAYLGNLIQANLLANPHHVRLVMEPDLNKSSRDNESENTRLSAMLSAMGESARRAVHSDSSGLQARQAEPQDTELLPKVTLADVPTKLPVVLGAKTATGGSVTHHFSAATNGLCYLQLAVDLPHLESKALRHLPLLCEYLTELGAGSENYLETQERRARVGNIGVYGSAQTSLTNVEVLNGRLVVSAKGLARKQHELFDNLFEVIQKVRFDELNRLRDLITQSRTDSDASITDRGHQLAMHGASRGLSRAGLLDNLWDGPANISFIQELDTLCARSNEALEDLAESFDGIRVAILRAPWRTLVVAEEHVVPKALAHLQTLSSGFTDLERSSGFDVTETMPTGNCTWIANTQVNFCAKAYLAVPEAHADAAALSVLAHYLQDGFLHPEIREKGGAYGAGAQFDPESATFRFYSYRDPRLSETLQDFDQSLRWLHSAEDPQRLEESILGVIRSLDTPRTPAGAAIHAFYNEIDGRSREFRMAHRDAVLGTTFNRVLEVAERYLRSETGAVGVITNNDHEDEIDALGLTKFKL
ncbi:MAG: Zn-dependent M16 (insulinase) family peptidase [Gammaproteobacteria bacterium]|jgi:Zn-dependent M16 (insulinase) family peptidase